MRKTMAVWPFRYFHNDVRLNLISLSCHGPVPTLQLLIQAAPIEKPKQDKNRHAIDVLTRKQKNFSETKSLSIPQIKPRHQPNKQYRPSHKHKAQPNIAEKLVREVFISISEEEDGDVEQPGPEGEVDGEEGEFEDEEPGPRRAH